jgi:hypothetical protein
VAEERGLARRRSSDQPVLLVAPPLLAPPLGVQEMSTDPASVVPSGAPFALQLISTVPDSVFCECPSSVMVNCCGGVVPLDALT